jgi:RNA polymerase sigma-70 factor (ECF subfamily)
VKVDAVEAVPDPSVREALDRLPVKQRLPVVLHYMEGYSLKEVADMLHLPESTLRGRLYQARQALKLALDDEMEDQYK